MGNIYTSVESFIKDKKRVTRKQIKLSDNNNTKIPMRTITDLKSVFRFNFILHISISLKKRLNFCALHSFRPRVTTTV